jgi:hypothetical protein
MHTHTQRVQKTPVRRTPLAWRGAALAVLLLARCVPQDSFEPLPTLVQLPTRTAAPVTSIAQLPPSWTPTFTLTAEGNASATQVNSISTSTARVTASATITDTPAPTLTASPVPTAEPRAVDDLLSLALVATVVTPIGGGVVGGGGGVVGIGGGPTPTFINLPPAAVGTVYYPPPVGGGNASATPFNVSTCLTTPQGNFAAIYNVNPLIATQLGCAVSAAVPMASAGQAFERGTMVWLQIGAPPSILSLATGGRFQRFDDTFAEGVDPVSGNLVPPAPNLIEPIRGFGKVWRANPAVQNGIGWAVAAETGGTATLQTFERGLMIALPQFNTVYMLVNDANSTSAGGWQSFGGGF